MKQRSIPLCIILSLITCGLYTIYWFFMLNDDVNEVSHSDGPTSLMAFLLTIITCGIYGLYWMYRVGERLEGVRAQTGRPTMYLPLVLLLLSIFGFGLVSYCIIQNEINVVNQTKQW